YGSRITDASGRRSWRSTPMVHSLWKTTNEPVRRDKRIRGRRLIPRGPSPARTPRRPGLPKPATTPTRRAESRQEISMEYDPNPPTPEEVAEAFREKYGLAQEAD